MENELNLLITRNIEGHKAYSQAADDVSNENFKSFLKSYAVTKKEFADELRKILHSKGLEIKPKSTVLSDVQRGFLKVKMMLIDSKDKALLKECERAEARSLEAYEKIMEQNALLDDVMSVVLRQRSKVLATTRALREMVPILQSESIQLKSDKIKSNS